MSLIKDGEVAVTLGKLAAPETIAAAEQAATRLIGDTGFAGAKGAADAGKAGSEVASLAAQPGVPGFISLGGDFPKDIAAQFSKSMPELKVVTIDGSTPSAFEAADAADAAWEARNGYPSLMQALAPREPLPVRYFTDAAAKPQSEISPFKIDWTTEK